MPPNNHTGPYVLEDCPHGCDQRAPSSLEGSEQAVEPLSPALQPLQKKKQQLQAKTLRGRSSKGSPKPALYFTAQTPTNRSHEAEFWNMSKTGLGERLWLEVRNMVQNGDPRPRNIPFLPWIRHGYWKKKLLKITNKAGDKPAWQMLLLPGICRS